MLIVLTGKTNSGKSSTQNAICSTYKMDKLVTFTTRKPRHNEKNGIDYNFVSCETFLTLKDEGYFLEYKAYNTFDEDGNPDVWYYGTAKHTLKDNSCVVLTPSGLKELLKCDLPYDVYSIYLDIDEQSLKRKQIERGDNEKEAQRRLDADNLDFVYIYDNVDFVIDNTEFKLSAEEVAKEIMLRIIDSEPKTNEDGIMIRRPNFTKRVYISHAYGGIEENLDRVGEIIYHLSLEYPTYNFYSPLHCFSHAYHTTDYQLGLDYCLDLLDLCDEMWVFDSEIPSVGVNAEIQYCRKYGIDYEIWDKRKASKIGIN